MHRAVHVTKMLRFDWSAVLESLHRMELRSIKLGLCYPSNLLLEYSPTPLASTRVLA